MLRFNIYFMLKTKSKLTKHRGGETDRMETKNIFYSSQKKESLTRAERWKALQPKLFAFKVAYFRAQWES